MGGLRGAAGEELSGMGNQWRPSARQPGFRPEEVSVHGAPLGAPAQGRSHGSIPNQVEQSGNACVCVQQRVTV